MRTSSPNGAEFELLDLRREPGRLVVEGRWSGVRGMRFVRPALIVGERELLATLDHKPWPPDARTWRAAFPWDGGAVRPEDVALAVAPSIVVPLTPGGHVPAPRREAAPLELREPEAPAAPPAPAPAQAGPPARSPVATAAPAPPAPPSWQPAPPLAPRPTASEASVLPPDRHLRERLEGQHEEAVRDREAALRTRARMETERDAARAATEQAARDRDEAVRRVEAERDDALRQLAQARAQRDEALVAHRALQRRVDGLLAHGTAPDPLPASPSAAASDAEPDADAPLGVRAVPAAAGLAPALHREETARARRRPGAVDLWAVRVLGTVTAVCFLVLLVLLLRVFL